jgi:uncharacterized protein (TIRG00374 family)
VTSSGRLLKVLLGIAVSGALLGYLLWSVDLKAVGNRLTDTHWGFLIASIVFNVVTYAMRAWRWRYLFPPRTPPSHLLNAVVIGYMGNNILPLRAGEVLRAYVASRRGPGFWMTLATLLVERVLDGLAIGLMLASTFLFMPVPRELQWAAFLFLSVDLAAMVMLAVITIAPRGCRRLLEAIVRRPRLQARLLNMFNTVNEGLEGLRTPAHLFPIVAWSIGIWVFVALSVWTGLFAARLDLPFGAAWTVLAFMGLGVSLPSSPGFVGVLQAAAVLALDLFHVSRADSLSFSLLYHASQYFPVTVWGLFLLVVEQVSLSDATRVRVPTVSSQI